jgi:hypothetical protein
MKKFKLFWAWEDEKEEKWLADMSRRGWHLEAPGFPGFYHFVKGEPRDHAYCLDFRTGSLKSLQEYLQICRDAGWEMIGRMGSWYYFRKECRDGEKAEFFSDRQSKVQKYQRLSLFLVIFLPILLNGLRLLFQRETSWALTVSATLYLLLICGWIYAMVRLLLRIKKLKKN